MVDRGWSLCCDSFFSPQPAFPSLSILSNVKTTLNLFLLKEQAVNFEVQRTCLFWFKGTSAQGLLLQNEVRRSGLKPALPIVSFVMIWLLRGEWGEK